MPWSRLFVGNAVAGASMILIWKELFVSLFRPASDWNGVWTTIYLVALDRNAAEPVVCYCRRRNRMERRTQMIDYWLGSMRHVPNCSLLNSNERPTVAERAVDSLASAEMNWTGNLVKLSVQPQTHIRHHSNTKSYCMQHSQSRYLRLSAITAF